MFRSLSSVLDSNLASLLHAVLWKAVLLEVSLCMFWNTQCSYHLHACLDVYDTMLSEALQVSHPLFLVFKVLLKSPSLCGAQVPESGQAEFRECASMNCSNTTFQMWANGWETWAAGWPYLPSPLPRSRVRWAGSIRTRGVACRPHCLDVTGSDANCQA